jgi:SAM-dependent methyltransferase
MNNKFQEIRSLYKSSYETHGDSPASLLTPKGRGNLRYRALESLITRPGMSLLDYGCGLGYLLEYLTGLGKKVSYTGVDVIPEFVAKCREKYCDTAQFLILDPTEPIPGAYDIVFASGVFNLKTHNNEDESIEYATTRVRELFYSSRVALVCDFLSPYVDFQQPGAQHFPTGFISDFCARELTRRFEIRHDFLPYEYTLIAWRNDSIERPQNIFKVDA